MKQLITILLLLVASSLTAFSQSNSGYTMLADKVYIDYCDGQGYSKVSDCDKVLNLDMVEQELHMNGVESFIWLNKSTITQNGIQITTMKCVDREDINCIIDMFFYNNVIYIKISYSNIVIKYRINKVIPY